MNKEEDELLSQSIDEAVLTTQSDCLPPGETLPDDSSVEETAILAKSEFLGTMSQEIQTHMNQIIGMTELALATTLNEEQEEYLSLVKNSAHSLLDLLNGILDFSKIETGEVNAEWIDFHLRDCLDNPLKTLARTAEANGLHLTVRIDEHVPEALAGDPTRLRQILINLLRHEIQTTIDGEVYLGITSLSQSADEVRLQFIIGDTGHLPDSGQNENSIFAPDACASLKFGGKDYSWMVTLQLIRLMGGDIEIQQNRDVKDGPAPDGLTNVIGFFLRFRPQHKKPVATRTTEPLCLKDVPVLVVDDSPTDRQRLKDMLALWEMKADLARHALEAMVMMDKAHAAGTPYALVIADANMREVDGYALTKEIRQAEQLADTKMVILTSAAMRGDGQRCRELGISAYLPKPVDQSDLLHVVMAVLGGYGADNPEGMLITRHSLKESQAQLRVLLAEDNPMNQKFAVRLLEKWGHRVVVASTGKEAAEQAAKETFDLVLMDIHMPEMDGLEATAAIREQERVTGHASRIVAMTGTMADELKKQCEEAGMDGYLPKPIRIDELYNVLKSITVANNSAAS